MQDSNIFISKAFFFIKTISGKAKKSIQSFISFFILMINLKIVIKEFISQKT